MQESVVLIMEICRPNTEMISNQLAEGFEPPTL
jgi:hypothetical protein